MRKLIILTLAMVMALGTMAFATNTRVLTMGDNNAIMLDDANIWLYPSRINQYPNLAIAEAENYYGIDGMYQVGVHWKFGEQKPWVLGTYISTSPDVFPSSYSTANLNNYNFGYGYWDEYYPSTSGTDAAGIGSESTNRRIDLIYGRKLGTTMFGFGLDYIHNSDSYTSWDTSYAESKFSFTQYTFALGLTPEKGNWDVSLGLSLGTWKDEAPFKDSMLNDSGTAYIVSSTITKPDGYYDFGISGRYFYQYSPTLNFVPHVAFTMGSHSQLVDTVFMAPAYSVKSKQTAMIIGCGLHYMPTTNVLAVLDFGVMYRKVTNEEIGWRGHYDTSVFNPYPNQSEKITDLPYWKIGVEGEVFNWMDIRMGAVSEWQSVSAEWKWRTERYQTEKEKWNWAENQTFLGFGLNFNRLHIDTYTDPQIILDGFNFISGSDEAYDLNFQVSVLYEMF